MDASGNLLPQKQLPPARSEADWSGLLSLSTLPPAPHLSPWVPLRGHDRHPKYLPGEGARCGCGRIPVTQLYNGMVFPPAPPFRRTRNVLFVGRLEAVKGVDILLRAVALACEQV